MPDGAKIKSVEALDEFRISLVLYREKALGVLDEAHDEIVRTRLWLQEERRPYWEREVRRRAQQLEAKRAELFSARMSPLREVTQAEQAAVAQATRALREAETKLSRVKQWIVQYDRRVYLAAKAVDQLRDMLGSHMDKAIAFLAQTGRTLEAYRAVSPRATAAATGAGSDAAPATVDAESEASKP